MVQVQIHEQHRWRWTRNTCFSKEIFRHLALCLCTRFPVIVAPFIKKDKLSVPPPIKNTWRMSDREVALVGKWSRFLSSQGGGERRKRVFLTVLMADALVSVKLDPTFDLCHVSVNPITVRCWWKWFCRKKGMWKDREERNMRRGAGSSGWENVWGFSGVCLPPHHNTVVSFKCVSVCVCVCVLSCAHSHPGEA